MFTAHYENAISRMLRFGQLHFLDTNLELLSILALSQIPDIYFEVNGFKLSHQITVEASLTEVLTCVGDFQPQREHQRVNQYLKQSETEHENV